MNFYVCSLSKKAFSPVLTERKRGNECEKLQLPYRANRKSNWFIESYYYYFTCYGERQNAVQGLAMAIAYFSLIARCPAVCTFGCSRCVHLVCPCTWGSERQRSAVALCARSHCAFSSGSGGLPAANSHVVSSRDLFTACSLQESRSIG